MLPLPPMPQQSCSSSAPASASQGSRRTGPCSRSPATSTASLSPWSSQPPASRCFLRDRCSNGWIEAWTSAVAARGTYPSGSAPCARRSTGATTSSTPQSRRSSRVLPCFGGGCTLESAEAVVDADLDTMQSLVDKSLLRHTDERFWMLETIREYAAERLEADGHAEELRLRHANWHLALARGDRLTGDDRGQRRPAGAGARQLPSSARRVPASVRLDLGASTRRPPREVLVLRRAPPRGLDAVG